MNNQELKEKIRKLVSKDKLESALETLLKFYKDNEKIDDIIIQSARYENIRNESIDGRIDKNEFDKELNSLRRNILSFVKDNNILEEDLPPKGKKNNRLDLKQGLKTSSIEELETNIGISMAKIAVADILVSNYKKNVGYSVTAIFKESNLKIRRLVFEFLEELYEYKLLDKVEGKETLWMLNEKGYQFFKGLTGKVRKN